MEGAGRSPSGEAGAPYGGLQPVEGGAPGVTPERGDPERSAGPMVGQDFLRSFCGVWQKGPAVKAER